MGGVGSGARPGQGLGKKRGRHKTYKARSDIGKKRGDYNSKHGLLGREFPRAYRSWYAMRERCNNPNNPPG